MRSADPDNLDIWGFRLKGWQTLFIAVFLSDAAMLIWGDQDAFSQNQVLEDAYYYLKLAQNLVSGQGLSVDGVNSTAGFHPLHLLLLLPGAHFWQGLDFVSYSGWLCAAYHAAAAALAYALLVPPLRSLGAGLVALAWALAPTTRQLFLNGMETGLFVCLLMASLLVFRAWREGHWDEDQGSVRTGLALGLAYLARTDAALLGLAMVIYIRPWKKPGEWRSLLRVAGAAAALILPWAVVCTAIGGHPFPSSLGPARNQAMIFGGGWMPPYIGDTLDSPWLDSRAPSWALSAKNFFMFGPVSAAWSLPFSAWMAPGEFFAYPKDIGPIAWFFKHPVAGALAFGAALAAALAASRRLGLGLFGIFACLLFLTYVWLPGPPWYAHRYMTPFLAFLSLCVLGTAWRWGASWGWPGAFLLALGIGWMARSFAAQYVYHFPKPMDHYGYRIAADHLAKSLPREAVIGSTQSGNLGFFCPQTVVNLDGVVNTAAWDAQKEGRMQEYIKAQGIDYVVDGGPLIEHLIQKENPATFGRDFEFVEWKFFEIYRVKRTGSASRP